MSKRWMRCGGLCSAALAAMVAMALTVTPAPPAGASSSGQADPLTADNFWLTTATGDLYAFGVPSYGSPGGAPLNKPIVSMVPTRNQLGYWMVASDGGIFSYGNAPFYGSTGNIVLNKPIVGMEATSNQGGYWMVASDGGIFSYGDATFYGSTGNIVLNQPIVGMQVTPDGRGYWLVASDGGVFSFGDAAFYGSTGNLTLDQPIVGMDATPDGKGYWLVAADGGVFAFGDARLPRGPGGAPGHHRFRTRLLDRPAGRDGHPVRRRGVTDPTTRGSPLLTGHPGRPRRFVRLSATREAVHLRRERPRGL